MVSLFLEKEKRNEKGVGWSGRGGDMSEVMPYNGESPKPGVSWRQFAAPNPPGRAEFLAKMLHAGRWIA